MKAKDNLEIEDFKKLCQIENDLRSKKYQLIAGVDESGRGAWAGPLVAAAVIIPQNVFISGLKDCKQITPKTREKLFKTITDSCFWSVAIFDVKKIEALGLQKTNLECLKEAIKKLSVKPDFVLSDGYLLPNLEIPNKALIKGDSISACIAAASIVCKVTRDRIMDKLDKEFPSFGFSFNKGYGTKYHQEALARWGPSKIHRKNFSPIKKLICEG